MSIPRGDRINVYRSKTTIYCEFRDHRYEVEWSDYNKEVLRCVEDISGCFLAQIIFTVGELEHDHFLPYREYVNEKLKTMVEW